MVELSSKHGPIAEDARRYRIRIAERIIEAYGLCLSDEKVEGAVAEITGEVLDVVRGMLEGGLPAKLAIFWGDECMNGTQERLLDHIEYLKIAAALVGFDPCSATRDG